MKKKIKQIAAIIIILLLLSLYIITFVFALTDSPNSGRLFQASLFATIGIPILLWIWLSLYKAYITRKEKQK